MTISRLHYCPIRGFRTGVRLYAFGVVIMVFLVVATPVLNYVEELASPIDCFGSRRKDDINLEETTKSTQHEMPSPLSGTGTSFSRSLLPATLNLVRRGVALDSMYRHLTNDGDPRNQFKSECSCSNNSAPTDCCVRYLHSAHKMGVNVAKSLLSDPFVKAVGRRRAKTVRRTTPRRVALYDDLDMTNISALVDSREVILLRNIYDSIISAYRKSFLAHALLITELSPPRHYPILSRC